MKTIKIKVEELGKKSINTYCRNLLEEGEDPETRVEVYRGDCDDLGVDWDFAATSIGEGAKWVLKEEPRLHYEKYKGPPDLK